jgi:[protein-PII] uridylyltransferase
VNIHPTRDRVWGTKGGFGSLLARHRELVLAGDLAVEWSAAVPGAHLTCTVVAPDRTGLLATVAGTLALLGFDISAASAYSHRGGMAIEVFSGTDRFGRVESDADRTRARDMLAAALAGTLALDEQLAERTRRYRSTTQASAEPDVRVVVDLDASAFATVVEVHAPDDVGLLARVAAAFAALDLDVAQAIVSTVGDRVVDVFYLRDANGQKITDPATLDGLRAAVLAHVTSPA